MAEDFLRCANGLGPLAGLCPIFELHGLDVKGPSKRRTAQEAFGGTEGWGKSDQDLAWRSGDDLCQREL
jgi:hypothetical protein